MKISNAVLKISTLVLSILSSALNIFTLIPFSLAGSKVLYCNVLCTNQKDDCSKIQSSACRLLVIQQGGGIIRPDTQRKRVVEISALVAEKRHSWHATVCSGRNVRGVRLNFVSGD